VKNSEVIYLNVVSLQTSKLRASNTDVYKLCQLLCIVRLLRETCRGLGSRLPSPISSSLFILPSWLLGGLLNQWRSEAVSEKFKIEVLNSLHLGISGHFRYVYEETHDCNPTHILSSRWRAEPGKPRITKWTPLVSLTTINIKRVIDR
jgi:hypothetical protein